MRKHVKWKMILALNNLECNLIHLDFTLLSLRLQQLVFVFTVPGLWFWIYNSGFVFPGIKVVFLPNSFLFLYSETKMRLLDTITVYRVPGTN